MTKLFALVVIVASLVLGACEKKNPFTGPTTTCEDTKANNFGGPLPCTYPPPSVVDIGGVGFRDMRSGQHAGVEFAGKNYPGAVEVRVSFNEPGTHQILFALVNQTTNIAFKYVAVETASGDTVSLPHDGSACRPIIKNVGTVVLSGSANFVYRYLPSE